MGYTHSSAMGTAVLWHRVKKVWIAEVHPVQHGQADAARLAEGRLPGAPGPVLPRPATHAILRLLQAGEAVCQTLETISSLTTVF